MATTFNPAVAVIQVGSWAVMPLASLFALDEGLDTAAVSEALGHGETWVDGGAAAAVAYIVNLDHRDTPMHFPNIGCAIAAYAAFCFLRGLDHVDAAENLSRVSGENFWPVEVGKWLQTYMDHFDELGGRPLSRVDQIRFVTDQGDNHRTWDAVRIWIAGVPFSADLTPQVERIARRIAADEAIDIIDARRPAPRFDYENACQRCGPTCSC